MAVGFPPCGGDLHVQRVSDTHGSRDSNRITTPSSSDTFRRIRCADVVPSLQSIIAAFDCGRTVTQSPGQGQFSTLQIPHPVVETDPHGRKSTAIFPLRTADVRIHAVRTVRWRSCVIAEFTEAAIVNSFRAKVWTAEQNKRSHQCDLVRDMADSDAPFWMMNSLPAAAPAPHASTTGEEEAALRTALAASLEDQRAERSEPPARTSSAPFHTKSSAAHTFMAHDRFGGAAGGAASKGELDDDDSKIELPQNLRGPELWRAMHSASYASSPSGRASSASSPPWHGTACGTCSGLPVSDSFLDNDAARAAAVIADQAAAAAHARQHMRSGAMTAYAPASAAVAAAPGPESDEEMARRLQREFEAGFSGGETAGAVRAAAATVARAAAAPLSDEHLARQLQAAENARAYSGSAKATARW